MWAAALLRCTDKQLWRRIEFYVDRARALESFEGVQIVGIDETSLKRVRRTALRPRRALGASR